MSEKRSLEAGVRGELPFDPWNPSCDICRRPLGWLVARDRVFLWTAGERSGVLLVCPRCEQGAAELLPPGLRRLERPLGGLVLLRSRLSRR